MTKNKKPQEKLEPFAAPLPGDSALPNQPGRGREVKIGLAVLALTLVAVGYVVATQVFPGDEAAVAVAEDGLGAEDSDNVFASLSADHIPAVVRPDAEPGAGPLLPAQWNAVATGAEKVAEAAPPIPSIPPMPSPAAAMAAAAGWNAGATSESRAAEQAGEPDTNPPAAGADERGGGLADSPPGIVEAAAAESAMASPLVPSSATVEPPPLAANPSAQGSDPEQPAADGRIDSARRPQRTAGPLPATPPDGRAVWAPINGLLQSRTCRTQATRGARCIPLGPGCSQGAVPLAG